MPILIPFEINFQICILPYIRNIDIYEMQYKNTEIGIFATQMAEIIPIFYSTLGLTTIGLRKWLPTLKENRLCVKAFKSEYTRKANFQLNERPGNHYCYPNYISRPDMTIPSPLVIDSAMEILIFLNLLVLEGLKNMSSGQCSSLSYQDLYSMRQTTKVSLL